MRQITVPRMERMRPTSEMSILRMNARLMRVLACRAVALCVGGLLVLSVSCSGKRITKVNVDQVTEGMSKKQVESILGPPNSLTTEDFVITKKTTYVYRQGKDTVTIVFKDDKVQSKDSTLSD
jgi:outer membrane protein assembly factor BamE (lipoprotein component of BamABCDE complex)